MDFMVKLNMMMRIQRLYCAIIVITSSSTIAINTKNYTANWTDLDSRPLPQWYDHDKIGVFISWGIHSVPSLGDVSFGYSWQNDDADVVNYIKKTFETVAEYKDFANLFTAEFYDPKDWAALFYSSGIKYVILAAKNDDGFHMYASNTNLRFNSLSMGPGKDIVQTLSDSVRNFGMTFGVCYHLFEWTNALFNNDANKFFNSTNDTFVATRIWPDIKQLVNEYKPSILWVKGTMDAPDTYYKTKELLTWLYNESPVRDVIVTNDKWGLATNCTHGDIFNCGYRYNPRQVMKHKWENVVSLDKKSWGFRRDAKVIDVMTLDELLETVVTTVSYGGNVLINVAPTKEGTILPIFQERLLEMGEWLRVNGQAIYGTTPWVFQNDSLTPGVWYTSRKEMIKNNATMDPITLVYAIFFQWPIDNELRLDAQVTRALNEGFIVDFIRSNQSIPLTWKLLANHAVISLPRLNDISTRLGWTVKITLKRQIYRS